MYAIRSYYAAVPPELSDRPDLSSASESLWSIISDTVSAAINCIIPYVPLPELPIRNFAECKRVISISEYAAISYNFV